MMMLILRRRKMAMLRRRMLRRKTDPKIGKHTLCEPTQSKCVTQAILYGNLQAKCRTRIPRHPFCASLRSQNAHGHVTGGILRGKKSGKMPDATDTTSIEPLQCGHTVWGKSLLALQRHKGI